MQRTLQNRTIFCRDNLDILKGMDTATIDLIYLDPPFNKKKVFTAPLGSSAEGAKFSDIFRKEDVKDEWVRTIREDHIAIHELLNAVKNIEGRTSYNFCYLAYMAIRLLEMRRILKDSGSIYVHCDQTMSHYLKLLLDCIFLERNFVNEIVWNYGTPSGGRAGGKKPVKVHDSLLVYARNYSAHVYHRQYTPYDRDYLDDWFRNTDEAGRRYQTRARNGEIIRQYLDESKGVPLSTVWAIKQLYGQKGWFPTRKPDDERTGYPTQKPLALLERVIAVSSSEGDVVLDPFCGCATTCVAAEKLGRRWVGVDISVEAYNLVKKRLKNEVANPESLFDWDKEISFSTEPPERTDGGVGIIEQKYVYIISHPHYPGEYKVGVASDAESRLSAYQTSDPNRAYKLEYKLLTPHYRALERHIHQLFENKHEWVRAEKAAIIREIGAYAPPTN